MSPTTSTTWGWCCGRRGGTPKRRECYERALVIVLESGDHSLHAKVVTSLARLLVDLHDIEGADRKYGRPCRCSSGFMVHHPPEAANTLMGLGIVGTPAQRPGPGAHLSAALSRYPRTGARTRSTARGPHLQRDWPGVPDPRSFARSAGVVRARSTPGRRGLRRHQSGSRRRLQQSRRNAAEGRPGFRGTPLLRRGGTESGGRRTAAATSAS